MLTDEQLQQAALKEWPVFMSNIDNYDMNVIDRKRWIDAIKSDTARKYHTQEWIPVTERMPNTYTPVLFYIQNRFQMFASVEYIDSDGNFNIRGVTTDSPPIYWMPLPEPPKQ